MDAIEKAIRQAFEKGDARDRAFREKVYRSVFAALERTLGARGDIPEDVKQARRNRLKAKITEIETEFVPAQVQPAPTPQAEPRPVPPQPQPQSPKRPAPAPSREEDFAPRVERDERRAEPRPPSEAEKAKRVRAALPRRRRPFAMLFLVATLVAFLGIGIWWSVTNGIFLSAEQRDTSVPNPPLLLEEEDYSADGGRSGSRATGQWLTVFSPADPTTVAAPGNASAEVLKDDNSTYIRMSSSADTAIVFDVGRGILETLAGKRAIFSISARSQDGSETQMSVSCHFGTLGNCGRKRYVVGPSTADYLFEIEFPDGDPGGAGTIAIVPDVDGRGRTLDVFSIRAASAQ